MSDKTKKPGRAAGVPDQRLARVFHFTPAELAANRAGYMMWQQHTLFSAALSVRGLWRSGLVLLVLLGLFVAGTAQRSGVDFSGLLMLVVLFGLLFLLLYVEGAGRAGRVDSLCGRMTLRYEQKTIYSHFRTEMHEYHWLVFPGHERRFMLTQDQYKVLTDGLVYRVYYMPGTNNILSIERVTGSCDGASYP